MSEGKRIGSISEPTETSGEGVKDLKRKVDRRYPPSRETNEWIKI